MTSTLTGGLPIGGLPGHSYDPEPEPPDETIELSRYGAEQIAYLLDVCDEFFRSASSEVTGELADHLAGRPGGSRDTGFFIDTLSFDALRLHRKLDPATAGNRQEQTR